nr:MULTISPECIES: universal stress protein [Halobacterium]
MSIPVQRHDGTPKKSSIATHRPVSSQSYDLLVPLPDAKTADYNRLDIHRLLRTPLAIANDRNGSVTIASIVTAPSEISLDTVGNESFSEEMTRVIDLARDHVANVRDAVADYGEDVPVSGLVIVAHTPDDVFAECTTGERYDAVFLAQDNENGQQLWDESLLNMVLETADCAVYLETLGTKADPLLPDPEDATDRDDVSALDTSSNILLAVGPGPHTILGAETARALGSTYGTSIRGVHLYESTDAERFQQGRKALDLTEYVLSDFPDVECESRASEDVVAELLQEIEKYDVAILGAPTKQPLLQRLFGQSVPDELEPQPTTSILTVRQPSHALSSVYYRWKRAIERTSVGEDSPVLEDDF